MTGGAYVGLQTNKFMIRTGCSKVAFRREVGYVANVEL